MRVSSRRLLPPVAVVVALFAPGVSAATAASPPAPERITGIVQTIIGEQPPSQRIDAHDGVVNDTTKVLRVGTRIVSLTDGSLSTAKDGTRVSATVLAGSDGAKTVTSSTTISAPADAAIPPIHQV
jgi:hypothetical protein